MNPCEDVEVYHALPPYICGYGTEVPCGERAMYIFRLKSWPSHHRGLACVEHGQAAVAKFDLEWMRSIT